MAAEPHNDPETLRQQCDRILASMSYLPGWKVQIENIVVRLHTTTFSVRTIWDAPQNCATGEYTTSPGGTFTLDMKTDVTMIDKVVTDEDIKSGIDKAITLLWEHEHKEWLKFNGEHYRAPHPELRRNW